MDLPRDTIGPYRLTKRIGGGGIGDVFAAVHEHMNQKVALKILSKESASNPQLVARFLQEARALTSVQHASVVRAFHFDKLPDGTAYLAMEYLEGVTLRQWLKDRKSPVPLETAMFIAREIADAMVEVHDRGIVHRDLKPENIMLVASDDSPIGHRIKLLDFGIAKVPPATGEDQANTQVQTGAPTFLGTPMYMAPEQCRNVATVTDRADVYALGVVLFELLTGKPPFDSSDPVELMSMHMQVQPPHLEDVAQHVPPTLGAFVSSMMEKDPFARPAMARCRDKLARSWGDEEHTCPFPGLSPFTEAHAELFFGRHEEMTALAPILAELERGELRWLQIEGHGGSGRTSLVQAAVVPKLVSRSAGEQPWLVATLRPTATPIAALASALSSVYGARSGQSQRELETALAVDDDALATALRSAHPSGSLLLLVIDQLEELFTLGAPHVARVDALLFNALTAPDSPLRLLTTLRSDHAHSRGHLPRLASLAGRTRRHYLQPIEEAGLLQVIRGMTSRAGLRLSDGLPERIARDAVGTDNRLPLLGHMLRSLWSHRPGLVVTHEHYERLGGIGRALLQQANALLDGLGEAGRERARWLLLDLVQVGRGAPDTRRSRTRSEALTAAGGDRLAEDVLVRLAGGATAVQASPSPGLGILVLSSDPGADIAQQRVDLVHDTLLRQVPAIASWIDKDRELLERRADLETVAAAWHQVGRPIEELPTGTLLEHYRWPDVEAVRRGRLTPMASERARTFLDAARDLQRRRSRRRQHFVASLVAVVLAIVVIAWNAWQQRKRAEANLQSVILTTKQVVSDTDWDLSRVLYTLKPRQALLEHIDNILASLPEADKATQEVIMATAESKHRRSDLARQNESLLREETFIANARKQIDMGLKSDPSNRSLLELAAINDSKRGKLALARGQAEEARAAFVDSVALLQRLGGDDDDYRRTLATSLVEQSEAEIALGHAARAEILADDAIELLDKNDDDYDRSQLALALRVRGLATRSSGDGGTASAFLERARSLQESLVERESSNVYYQWILATINADLAVTRRREGRLEDADALSRGARQVADDLHRGDPTHKEYALLLCRAWSDWADVSDARGDKTGAKAARSHTCEVAARLHLQDSEDERFRRFPCP